MTQKQEIVDNNLNRKKQFLRGLEDVKFERHYGHSDLIKDPTTNMGLLYKQGWLFGKDISLNALDNLIANMKHLIETETTL